jgi:hypothetical protein
MSKIKIMLSLRLRVNKVNTILSIKNITVVSIKLFHHYICTFIHNKFKNG